MKTLKFKTTINCGGCIAKITLTFNEHKELIKNWEVDTASPDRVLSIETDAAAAEIIAIVENAGFKATEI